MDEYNKILAALRISYEKWERSIEPMDIVTHMSVKLLVAQARDMLLHSLAQGDICIHQFVVGNLDLDRCDTAFSQIKVDTSLEAVPVREF